MGSTEIAGIQVPGAAKPLALGKAEFPAVARVQALAARTGPQLDRYRLAVTGRFSLSSNQEFHDFGLRLRRRLAHAGKEKRRHQADDGERDHYFDQREAAPV